MAAEFDIKLPKVSIRLILMGLAVLVGAAILLGSSYQVQPEEEGLALRFGRLARTTAPGLNLKLPFIETVTVVRFRFSFWVISVIISVGCSWKRV